MSEHKTNVTWIDNPLRPLAGPATTAAVGAGAGYGVVAASGMTAAGMVGGGAGIGMAAGPLGAAAGALFGLAVYGIYRATKDGFGTTNITVTVDDEPDDGDDSGETEEV